MALAVRDQCDIGLECRFQSFPSSSWIVRQAEESSYCAIAWPWIARNRFISDWTNSKFRRVAMADRKYSILSRLGRRRKAERMKRRVDAGGRTGTNSPDRLGTTHEVESGSGEGE